MNKLEQLIQELCPHGVEYKKFWEVAEISRGASPRPIHNYLTNDVNGVNWIKIGDVGASSKYIVATEEKITEEGAKKSKKIKPGDFILSNSMSFGRPYISKIYGCIHDGWLSITNFEQCFISDFLYYLICSQFVQNQMKMKVSAGTIQNLNAERVKSLDIPVPPLEVQKEIVRILDMFTELEKELEARKKQYAYYRDNLLTLKIFPIKILLRIGEKFLICR